MKRNLTKSPRCDVVKGALPLQAGKHSLNGWSLPMQGLPFRGLHPLPKLSHEGLVAGEYVNDRLGTVLLTDQVHQGPTGIALVRHYCPRAEPAVSQSGLSEHIRGSFSIMDVTGADVSRDRHFIFTVYEKMKLPAPDELLLSLGILLHRPSRNSRTARCYTKRTAFTLECCQVTRDPACI